MARNKWGIVVGKPTELHPNKTDGDIQKMIGKWVLIDSGALKGPNGEALFNTKYAATKQARVQAKFNRFWNYHAKKFPQ